MLGNLQGEMTLSMTLKEPTEELVLKAQEGSAAAFARLATLYRDRLQSQVEARMGDAVKARVEAADIVQDTFSKALESIRYFQWRGDDSFYRWLGTIAEHLIWNIAKKRSTESLRLDPENQSDPSAGKRLQRAERFERLEAALETLHDDQREAVLLARIDGMSLNEVARRMGRSPGAVQKLVARALLALRDSFGDTGSLNLPDRALREGDGDHE